MSPKSRTLPYCNDDLLISDTTKEYEVMRTKPDYADETETEQIAWIWCLIFAYVTPECLAFLRSLRVILFKHWARPDFLEFAFVALTECAGAAGFAILAFKALPQLDSTHALALTNCFCVVPGVLQAMSRKNGDNHRWIKFAMDIVAVLAQISGILVK